MFLSDIPAQIDTAGAIVSAPADSGAVQTITVTGERPNYWPWIIVGVLVVAALIYYGRQRK